MFKRIDGFLDYSIDNEGNVVSFKHKKRRKVCLSKNKRGYFKVGLYNGGKREFLYVARLVAKAFIGPIDGLTINHKDGNKLNNCVSNLEIVTMVENIKHSIRTGLRGNCGRERIIVKQLDCKGRFIAVYNSIREANRKTNIDCRHISSAIKGRQRSAGGFIWKAA